MYPRRRAIAMGARWGRSASLRFAFGGLDPRLPYLCPCKGRKGSTAKRMAQRERDMAKGMNKQGKNVKKPKKEKAQTAVMTVPSTKNSVNIGGGNTGSKARG